MIKFKLQGLVLLFTEILTSYPIHLDRASATTFSDPGIC